MDLQIAWIDHLETRLLAKKKEAAKDAMTDNYL
jgi:hypothetical protein